MKVNRTCEGAFSRLRMPPSGAFFKDAKNIRKEIFPMNRKMISRVTLPVCFALILLAAWGACP